jgi:hypothetical protein
VLAEIDRVSKRQQAQRRSETEPRVGRRFGRCGEVTLSTLNNRAETAAARPFHKRGARGAACPRCWRSRRTAVSSSCALEQRPTSRYICSFTPTTDTRAIPAALPSPARAVALARANAALSELVQLGSGPWFARLWRTELGASTWTVVGQLPLRLTKEERCGHHPGSLLKIVLSGTLKQTERAMVGWRIPGEGAQGPLAERRDCCKHRGPRGVSLGPGGAEINTQYPRAE